MTGITTGDHELRVLEQEYVQKVYEEIAPHFDQTRRSIWGAVKVFLDDLPANSVVFDAGCGNGKYLCREDLLCKFGVDLCESLVQIAHAKTCKVVRGDALALPFRVASADAVLSVAVVHHFATRSRRLWALRELARVLRSGGRACVTAWAMEQRDARGRSSAYSRMRKIGEANVFIGEELSARCATPMESSALSAQDRLVPWTLPGRPMPRGPTSNRAAPTEDGGSSGAKGRSKQFLRYYHLFVGGELAELVSELADCRLVGDEIFEEGNWIVVFEKL